MPTFDVLVVWPIQAWFAWRAFLLLKRNWYFLGTALLLSTAAFVCGIGETIEFGNQPSLLGASHSGAWLIIFGSCTTAADVLIAVAIMWALVHSKTGWYQTDKTITRWIRLTFEAQLPPTVLALAYVIEWSQTPDSLLGALLIALEGKAYGVGLLYSLNARVSMRSMAVPSDRMTHQPQVFGQNTRLGPTEIHVEVETETYVHGERQRKDDSSSLELGRDQYALNELTGSQARLTDEKSMV
ncbi:hypothetical protein M231_07104 [Tremella mesenterica]|uniref:DUF6534 domain-containing protein n=1 Tax=Tremella mesenterica TaxID=5217 RepID=A0A4Q1BCZ1_TREME|nr:hypothetical protein M231_07104 [Tremella mesenterica]